MDENQDGYVDFEEMKRAIMEEPHSVLKVRLLHSLSFKARKVHNCRLVQTVICCTAWRQGAYNEVGYFRFVEKTLNSRSAAQPSKAGMK